MDLATRFDGPAADKPGDAGSPSVLRNALVDRLTSSGHIDDSMVEAAFRAVPRHLFLPQFPFASVYEDQGFITKTRDGIALSSSTGPGPMAYMLQHLDLRPGHRVLEIGAATGYNAALIAHIVGPSGHVVTVDIEPDVVEDARRHLSAAGYGHVKAISADGGYGYPDDAPYDRIILTTGAWDITPAWLEQLKPGGRLVLPLSIRGGHQGIVAFDNRGDRLNSGKIRPTGYIPLRGAFAGPTAETPIGSGSDAYVVGDRIDMDAETIYEMLTGQFVDTATGVSVTWDELYGLQTWLAAREPRTCDLNDMDGPGRIVPPFSRVRNADKTICWTNGIVEERGIAVFHQETGEEQPIELLVRGFGPDQDVAERLLKNILAWEAAGRPVMSDIRITVLPMDTPYEPAENEVMVAKRWNKLAVRFGTGAVAAGPN
jgi:protein-L-isoaspartate(D-aspartate) O-methyltransferase